MQRLEEGTPRAGLGSRESLSQRDGGIPRGGARDARSDRSSNPRRLRAVAEEGWTAAYATGMTVLAWFGSHRSVSITPPRCVSRTVSGLVPSVRPLLSREPIRADLR